MTEAEMTRGVIERVLPRALYRVRLDSGVEITASLSSQARQVTVRLIPGDSVMIELSPYDPTRGRIKERLT